MSCLDLLDIEADTYDIHPQFLSAGSEHAEETLYSNCSNQTVLPLASPIGDPSSSVIPAQKWIMPVY